jgi:hypothetical protein
MSPILRKKDVRLFHSKEDGNENCCHTTKKDSDTTIEIDNTPPQVRVRPPYWVVWMRRKHNTPNVFLMLQKKERIGGGVTRKRYVILFFTFFRGRLPWVNDGKSSMKKKNVVLQPKSCNTTGM